MAGIHTRARFSGFPGYCQFNNDTIKNEGAMLHYKSIGKHFWRSRASSSKANSPIWPAIKFVLDLTPAPTTCKFENDPIKTEGTIVSTTFFSGAQRQVTPKPTGGYGQNSNSSQILCLSWLHASLKKIRSKQKALAWRHHFPHYMSMGAFCCHGNHSFDGFYSKT